MELASKGIGDHTAVQLPALKKRKNDQALPPGSRILTNVKFRAHLVAAAMSRLKEAQRKVNKNKVRVERGELDLHSCWSNWLIQHGLSFCL